MSPILLTLLLGAIFWIVFIAAAAIIGHIRHHRPHPPSSATSAIIGHIRTLRYHQRLDQALQASEQAERVGGDHV